MRPRAAGEHAVDVGAPPEEAADLAVAGGLVLELRGAGGAGARRGAAAGRRGDPPEVSGGHELRAQLGTPRCSSGSMRTGRRQGQELLGPEGALRWACSSGAQLGVGGADPVGVPGAAHEAEVGPDGVGPAALDQAVVGEQEPGLEVRGEERRPGAAPAASISWRDQVGGARAPQVGAGGQRQRVQAGHQRQRGGGGQRHAQRRRRGATIAVSPTTPRTAVAASATPRYPRMSGLWGSNPAPIAASADPPSAAASGSPGPRARPPSAATYSRPATASSTSGSPISSASAKGSTSGIEPVCTMLLLFMKVRPETIHQNPAGAARVPPEDGVGRRSRRVERRRPQR